MTLRTLGLYVALAIVGALFVGILATSLAVFAFPLNVIYLGLYADFFGPLIAAVEIASRWCGAHPGQAFFLITVVLGAAQVVSALPQIMVDTSDEALP